MTNNVFLVVASADGIAAVYTMLHFLVFGVGVRVAFGFVCKKISESHGYTGRENKGFLLGFFLTWIGLIICALKRKDNNGYGPYNNFNNGYNGYNGYNGGYRPYETYNKGRNYYDRSLPDSYRNVNSYSTSGMQYNNSYSKPNAYDNPGSYNGYDRNAYNSNYQNDAYGSSYGYDVYPKNNAGYDPRGASEGFIDLTKQSADNNDRYNY